MNIPAIISSIFGPLLVISVFAWLNRYSEKSKSCYDGNNLIVEYPKAIAFFGVLLDAMLIIVMICLTLFSEETPHFIFYIIMGLFIWAGFYLILKTLTFKIIADDRNITVYSSFRKPYRFAFDDVKSVQRQVKGNMAGSERIIIKTNTGRKIIAESRAIGYKEFKRKIKTNVNGSLRKGL